MNDGGDEAEPDPQVDRTRRERAFVIIWMASLLIVLLAIAGFAVDLSHWWLEAEKLQRAVDAGAHAGAVFLPNNASQAGVTARTEVARNGFNDGAMAAPVNASVTATQMPNPYQLKVSATTTVDNFFLSLIGMDTLTVTRDAIGQFEQPVAMGSPENKVGNDPTTASPYNPQLWVNLNGPSTPKSNGNRFSTKNCGSASPPKCTGTVNPGISNDEYAFDGYFLTAEVRNLSAGQDLVIQVFDGLFAETSGQCSSSGATWPSGPERTTLIGLGIGHSMSQLQSGASSWCTGDTVEANDGSTGPGAVIVLVRGPDDTPWSNTDNPVISTSGCSPQQMPVFSSLTGENSIYNLLHPTAGSDALDPESNTTPPYGTYTFASTFRRWATVCTIPSGQVETGEYLVQFRSNAASEATAATYSASTKGDASNNMSFRVGFGSGGAAALDGSAVSLSARQRLPIYANANSATTVFTMARVTPADAGRTLRVTLYDMGDASSTGTLQFIPPADSNKANFTGCGFAKDNGSAVSATHSICRLNGVNFTNYQARSVNIDIPIPADYTCNDSTNNGCWITVRAIFTGGVYDTTTWSASILGSPVRLVE